MTRRRPVGAILGLAVALHACAAPNHLADHAAFADGDFVHVVVEIPAGTNEKWEVSKTDGALRREQVDGAPRTIQYLAYPANYGIVPRTLLPRDLGGDGDPLDVVLLGPRLDRGAVVRARPIGVLRLLDDGERDDKLVAVRLAGPLSEAVDLASLEVRHPGVLDILETWFTSYKGAGRATSSGFGDAADALHVAREASRHYEERVRSEARVGGDG